MMVKSLTREEITFGTIMDCQLDISTMLSMRIRRFGIRCIGPSDFGPDCESKNEP